MRAYVSLSLSRVCVHTITLCQLGKLAEFSIVGLGDGVSLQQNSSQQAIKAASVAAAAAANHTAQVGITLMKHLVNGSFDVSCYVMEE